VVRQEWGSQSEQQLAIRSVLDDLEGGEGEHEGFWGEGVSPSGGFGAWSIAGERLGEVVDVLRREGLARDGCFSLCHRVAGGLLAQGRLAVNAPVAGGDAEKTGAGVRYNTGR
jgi:hypothetical protein